jgi:hypothetical protein
MSPKRRGRTYSHHHRTPGYSTLTKPWSKTLQTHNQTSQNPICLLKPRSTQRQTDLRRSRLLPSSIDTHTQMPVKEQFHSPFTKYLHPRAQALGSSRFFKLICNSKSARITKRSGKREASSLIHSATGASFTHSSSQFLLRLTKGLSLASQNQRTGMLF